MNTYGEHHFAHQAVALGQQLRALGCSYSYVSDLAALLCDEEAEAVKGGYRGTIKQPQFCGGGSHLWRVQ